MIPHLTYPLATASPYKTLPLRRGSPSHPAAEELGVLPNSAYFPKNTRRMSVCFSLRLTTANPTMTQGTQK